MTRLFACMILIASAASLALCQSFEVASVKPSDAQARGVHIGVSPGGIFTATNITLGILIQRAWDVRDFQISGGPGWLDTERYDITAKGDGPGLSEDEMRKMTEVQRNKLQEGFLVKVRALLADRFQLKVHRATKESQVYALIAAKGGPKIHPATEDGSPGGELSVRRGSAGTEVTARNLFLGELVRFLSNQVGRTVLDKTGLKGSYDFKMSFVPDLGLAQPSPGAGDDRQLPESGGPSIFTAVQEQLGLKLDAQKGSVEVLVIDSAQKASAN
jgi:bla regulator protein BlaR1